MKLMKTLYRGIGIIFIFTLLFFNENILAQTSSQPYVHVVKKGESVYGVSRQYNVSIDDLYKSNPSALHGVKPGDKLIIPGKYSNVEAGNIEEKKESENSGVEVEKELQKESKEKDIKGEQTPKEVIKDNNDVLKEEEFGDILALDSDSIANQEIELPILEKIKIAVILDEPTSKKDIDFTRGALIALSDYKTLSTPLDLKIIDGRTSTNILTEELEDYAPTIIISTADKNFPAFLADYGNTNNVEVVNAFDLRNDLYEDNQSIIQILPPSKYYSPQIANGILNEIDGRKIIFVGTPDESDAIAKELKDRYDNYQELSLEEFGTFQPGQEEAVMVYSYASRKEDVYDFMTALDNLGAEEKVEFPVIGRSNWVALTDEFEDRFKEFNVIVPSRVYLDENSGSWQMFVEKYEDLFKGVPVRSIPNYAASGYDILNYFLPLIIENHGDFNSHSNVNNPLNLQSEFSLIRDNQDGGLINKNVYLVKFGGFAIEKQLID